MAEAAPRRLWLVSRVFAPDEGGVQTYAAELARAYAGLGWQVTVFAKSSAGPRRQALAPGVELVDVGPGKALAVYARLFRALRAAWASGARPAAIHACTWRAALPCLGLGAPLLVTVHGREVGRPRRLAFFLLRQALARATRIVAVSDTTRGLLLRRLPGLASRCITAWNGATPVPPPPPTAFAEGRGEAALLTLCRLVPRKNVPAALRAALSLLRHGQDFTYRVAGRGPDGAVLEGLLAEAGPEAARIALLGYVPEATMAALYRESDIFLHPQLALEDGDEIEGFGISVADAMMHGMVCIVGAEGGPAELVRHGETGFVVDGRDPAAIAAALAPLLRDPALRRRMGAAARAQALRDFSWQRHAEACLTGLRL